LSEKESVVSAERGEPVKKLVVVRSEDSVVEPEIHAHNEINAYSLDIVRGRPPPLFRFLAVMARMLGFCANALTRGSVSVAACKS
jgi:hypothetical protein